jgi:hypothetical protein
MSIIDGKKVEPIGVNRIYSRNLSKKLVLEKAKFDSKTSEEEYKE